MCGLAPDEKGLKFFLLLVLLEHDYMQMRGERQIIERLLQTEIAMLRAIRDGSALMQHMEDFYYIALLEVCLACFSKSDLLFSNFHCIIDTKHHLNYKSDFFLIDIIKFCTWA